MTSEHNRRKSDLNSFQQSCIALDNQKLRVALKDSEDEVIKMFDLMVECYERLESMPVTENDYRLIAKLRELLE